MSLSASTFQPFLAQYDSIDAAFDLVPSSPPASALARVRGTLKNVRANLAALDGQLIGRDATNKDRSDLLRLQRALESLLEDKWVTDAFETIDLQWAAEDLADAAAVKGRPKPIRLTDAIGMISDGLAALQS